MIYEIGCILLVIVLYFAFCLALLYAFAVVYWGCAEEDVIYLGGGICLFLFIFSIVLITSGILIPRWEEGLFPFEINTFGGL